MKKIIACLVTVVLMTQLPVFSVNAHAHDNNVDTIITSDSGKITDIDQIRNILNAYIADNELDAKIVSDENYPQYAGTVVIEFNTETSANTAIIRYAEKNNIERALFNLVPCVEGKPITTVNPDIDIITTTTTTTIVAEKITDIDQIRNILNAYIADNELDAKIVSDENYPQYAGTVVIEFNTETSANTAIIEYAEKSNIERTLFNLVPCVEGEPITTFNPDAEITPTTTTTTITIGDDNITTLPQTGYSDIYMIIVVIAALMTISGIALIIKSRKVKE